METFSAPLIPHLLLPDRDVGPIVANLGVEGREGGSKEDEGRLLGGELSLKGFARPLVGHGGSYSWMAAQGES